MPKKISPIINILVLVFIVFILNAILLKEFWNFGLNGEDWVRLLEYKSYDTNLLTKFVNLWKTNPFNWTILQFYMGGLDQLFPGNYSAIQTLNFIGKIVATVSLFIPIYAITRNELLVVLTTLFFATSYSSAGGLENFLNGVEYWGILFLNLFVLSLYKLIKNKNVTDYFTLSISVILLYITISLAFLRVIGILPLIVGIELVLVLTKYSSVKISLFRTFIFFLPAYLLNIFGAPGYSDNLIRNLFNNIFEGNLLIFINPLAGLALTIIPSSYMHFFGAQLVKSLSVYIAYLANSLLLLSIVMVTLISGFLLPVKSKRFIFNSLLLNGLLLSLVFILSSHFVENPNYGILPLAILGTLIISISTSLGIEWFLTKTRNLPLFLSFISPYLALFFTTLTWLSGLARNEIITYQDGVHRYLMIPGMLMSIFIASIFVMVLKRQYQLRLKKIFSIIFVFILTVFILLNSYNELGQYFKTRKNLGLDLVSQIKNTDLFYNNYIKGKRDLVIYYISSSQDIKDKYLEKSLVIDQAGQWSYLKQYYSKSYLQNPLGCIMVLNNPWYQKDATIREKGQIVFHYPAVCPEDVTSKDAKIFSQRWTTIPLDKLFAFTIKDGQIVDITTEIKFKLQQDISL